MNKIVILFITVDIFNPILSCKSSQIIYKACHARILDHRRKYLEAGQKYHEMSLMEEISDVDRTQALEKAIHCALLAPAGVHRTRLIGTFYKGSLRKNYPISFEFYIYF